MIRRLFILGLSIVAIVSVLVGILTHPLGTAVIWGRHASLPIGLSWFWMIADVQERTDFIRVSVYEGIVRVERRTTKLQKSAVVRTISRAWGPFHLASFTFNAPHRLHDRDDGAFVLRTRPHQSATAWAVQFPILAIPAVTAPYPIIAFIRGPLRRRRRRKRGLCPSCGYNLTGNTSGVCPECTATVEPEPPRSAG